MNLKENTVKQKLFVVGKCLSVSRNDSFLLKTLGELLSVEIH